MVEVTDISLSLKEDLDYLMYRVYCDFPAVLIIDGGTGSGKTTLAVQCCDYMIRKHIVLKDQLALGIEHAIKTLVGCYEQGYKVMIFDEATEFNKRRAMSKNNMAMIDLFAMARSLHVVIIICLPNVSSLDNEIKSHDFVFGLIHIFSRDENGCIFGAYPVTELGYLLSKMEDKTTFKMRAYEQVHPAYYGVAKNLSAARSLELHQLSTGYKVVKMQEKTKGKKELGHNPDSNQKNAAIVRDKVRTLGNSVLIEADKYLSNYRGMKYIDHKLIMNTYADLSENAARKVKHFVEAALKERGTIPA